MSQDISITMTVDYLDGSDPATVVSDITNAIHAAVNTVDGVANVAISGVVIEDPVETTDDPEP